MPLRDGFFSTATQTSCCNRIQRSNRVRLLVVSTHDFPDSNRISHSYIPSAQKTCYKFVLAGCGRSVRSAYCTNVIALATGELRWHKESAMLVIGQSIGLLSHVTV